MADARHTRKRSLCISNLRIMEQKTCNDANKPSRSPSSADSRARSLPARRLPSDSGSQKIDCKVGNFRKVSYICIATCPRMYDIMAARSFQANRQEGQVLVGSLYFSTYYEAKGHTKWMDENSYRMVPGDQR